MGRKRIAALIRKAAFAAPLLVSWTGNLLALPAGRLPEIGPSSAFLIYYGNDFGAQQLQLMSRFDAVVLNPRSSQMTPAVVATLKKAGVRYVFGYISIGEDDAPNPVNGNGEGPVFHNGTAIVPENRGIASFYVDQEWNGTEYVSDGTADLNSNFGGRFVLPNSDWRWVINTQRIGGSAGLPSRSVAGLQQLAGNRQSDMDQDRTHNFGFDGFFLDTIDTAGPFENVWGYYAWAAEEMRNTVQFVHETYPDKFILANRGLFFHNPNLHNRTFNISPYDFTIRPYINGVLFESYTLDSDPAHLEVSPYFADNKYNYAPKLIAEGNRLDGFTIFSLDYQLKKPDSLLRSSIDERAANGWVGYLAPDGQLDRISTYVLDHPPLRDTAPPSWSSAGALGSAPVPDRVGIQSVMLGKRAGEVIIHWDVARDQTPPVRYNIYSSSDPGFSNPVRYSAVAYSIGDGWSLNTSAAYANKFTLTGLPPGTYYFRVRAQDTSDTGREEQNTVTLSLVVPGSNPGSNIVVDGNLKDWSGLQKFDEDPDDVAGSNNPADWRSIALAHDGANLYFAYVNDGPITLTWAYTIYLDTDCNRATGFRGSQNEFPIGSDYILQGAYLFRYSGNGSNWSWTYVGRAANAVSGERAELALPRGWIENPSQIRFFAVADNSAFAGGTAVDLYPDGALKPGAIPRYLTYSLSSISNPVSSITIDGSLSDWSETALFVSDPDDVSGAANRLDWKQVQIAHNASRLFVAYTNDGPITLNAAFNMYIDSDQNRKTGFRGAGNDFPIGAEYLLQGSNLYRYTGDGTTWSWSWVGTSAFAVNGNVAEFSIPQSWIGDPVAFGFFMLGDNTIYPAGVAIDQYPDGAILSGGSGAFFDYRIR